MVGNTSGSIISIAVGLLLTVPTPPPLFHPALDQKLSTPILASKGPPFPNLQKRVGEKNSHWRFQVAADFFRMAKQKVLNP
jgi:hypothetical protein